MSMLAQNCVKATNQIKQYNVLSKTIKRLEVTVSYSTKPKTISDEKSGRQTVIPPRFRYTYPEFLPDPNVQWRNPLREKLERLDMVRRREHVDIPEFYVGSIMAVTSSDPHAQGKVSRFVGICIHREGCGLRSSFILRNVIDHQGIEVKYELYDPTVRKIEVLKLEKRLDDKLFYLRDALPEYSTFDPNMEAEFITEGAPVPVNPIKVKLKPRPWLERWARQDLKGIEGLERDHCRDTPWEKYDLMKQYKKTIPEEEQTEIYSEVYSKLSELEITRRKLKRKRTFALPKKVA